MKKTLIIQGGGFRTGFSAGVLDAFMSMNFRDFDFYIGVSGGTIALSYYLSNQYKNCFDAMCFLATNKDFMSMNNVISPSGIMNIDYFHKVANEDFPMNYKEAMENAEGKELAFVMTDLSTGDPHYYHPNRKTWIDAVIASCTMPFVTKGKHSLHGTEYMDGGWSDPLPIIWAYERGARDIVFIRTAPADMKVTQTWSDYFGSFVYRSDENLRRCFEENHLIYNKAIDFMNDAPNDLKLIQIAPEFPLKAGTYSNSIEPITIDYRHGLDKGLEFIRNLMADNAGRH